MRIAEENEGEWVIQENLHFSSLPLVCLFLLGILSAAACLSSKLPALNTARWSDLSEFALGLAIMGISGIALLIEPFQVYLVDVNQKQILIAHNRWELLGGGSEQVNFSEINALDVDTCQGFYCRRRSPQVIEYRLQLTLSNGHRTFLPILEENNPFQGEWIAAQLSQWISKP